GIEAAIALVELFQPQRGEGEVGGGGGRLLPGRRRKTLYRQDVGCRRETEVEIDEFGRCVLVGAVELPCALRRAADLQLDRLVAQPSGNGCMARSPSRIAGNPVSQACRLTFVEKDGGAFDRPSVIDARKPAAVVAFHVEPPPEHHMCAHRIHPSTNSTRPTPAKRRRRSSSASSSETSTLDVRTPASGQKARTTSASLSRSALTSMRPAACSPRSTG